MSQIIFDIETIGEDFDSLDETTREVLTNWIRKDSENEDEYQKALEDLKNGLGFSPLTGEIAAIGVLDNKTGRTAVFFQAPGEKFGEFEEGEIKFSQMGEKEMLEKFWEIAEKYKEFVTFNGRSFDVPFLMIRSAVHQIRPTKNLMSNRYLNSQDFSAKHIDLFDQLSFYGAIRRKGNLHLWSRVFGIKSPKAEGVTGDDVGKLFKEGKFKEIARYNARDLKATRELYEYWEEYVKF